MNSNYKDPPILAHNPKTNEVISDIFYFHKSLDQPGHWYVRYYLKNGDRRSAFIDRSDWLFFESEEKFKIYKKINDKL